MEQACAWNRTATRSLLFRRNLSRRCSRHRSTSRGSEDPLDEAAERMAESLLQGSAVDVEELKKIASASARVAAAQIKKKEFEKALLELEDQEKKQTVAETKAEVELKKAAETYLNAANALEEATAERTEALESAQTASLLDFRRLQKILLESGGDAAERVESVKALLISATVGLLCLLPFALDSENGPLSVALGSATCGLFGVTYRYAVRRDSTNLNLKGGVVAAFALARGFGEVDVYVRANEGMNLKLAIECALLCGWSFVVIFAAALGLEAAIQRGIVQEFPSAED